MKLKLKCLNVYSYLISLVLILIAGSGCAAKASSTNPSSSHFFNRKLLKQMKSYIDVETSPCEDFYQYACGQWAKMHSIANNELDRYTSATAKVNYEINSEYVQYLEAMNVRNKPEFVQKAHAFYQSCTRRSQMGRDLRFVMEWMQENENIRFAWLTPPHQLTEDADNFDWVHTLAVWQGYGLNSIFIEEAVYDRYEDIWSTVVGINKPILNYDFEPLTLENLILLAESTSFPPDVIPFQAMFEEILEFEKVLVKLDVATEDSGSDYATVQELPSPWLHRYLEIVLNQTPLDSKMEIHIANVAYMKLLDDLLGQYNQGFICRYLEVRFLHEVQQKLKILWPEDCASLTRGYLSLAMHWIYEQEHPELQQEIPKIQQIFDNIVGYIKRKMAADTSGIITQNVLDKLDNMQLKVGNLPHIDTVSTLDSFFERLTLDPNDFYGNLLKLRNLYFNASHTGYGNYYTRNISQLFIMDAFEDGSTFLPYYLNTPNVMMAPLTLMRQPFYHWGYDDVYKYSSLGNRFAILIIQDLIEHCGVQAEDQTKFAEISGFHSAYGAYYSLLPQDLRDEQYLRGSQLIFFLNYAQLRCEANQYYDLNPFVTHFPEFSKVFDCKLKKFLEAFEYLQNDHGHVKK